MTSELKSATSRANGAKSHGPKTAEGREKSSQNSLNHGFTAKKTVLLACENPAQFQEMLGDYAATYQPGSPVEEGGIAKIGGLGREGCRQRSVSMARLSMTTGTPIRSVEGPAFGHRRHWTRASGQECGYAPHSSCSSGTKHGAPGLRNSRRFGSCALFHWAQPAIRL